jgi:hypothetical protein
LEIKLEKYLGDRVPADCPHIMVFFSILWCGKFGDLLTLNRSKSSKIYTRKKSHIFPIFLLETWQRIVRKKKHWFPTFFILLNK